MRARMRLVVPLLAAALLLTGCTEPGPNGPDVPNDGLPQQWNDPTTDPVTFTGTTVDGKRFDSKTLLGDVVVVNFWYAGCVPCRAEAPILKKLAAERASDGVEFVGVNTRDDRSTAEVFDQEYEPGYPSVVDQEGDLSAQLAFAGVRGPNTTPTTIVLDRKGRVVARYGGLVNESVLDTLIGDAVDGKSA